ncbi:L-arabinose-binding periplasmic protein precursor [[Pasteurella] mairii]|uniref:L-arabinose-binding periplasmic protein n=1 Tax=[Pasteurella] mairii TaxID=757 RepID=A0A379B7U6_9PAST|nr:L-arabinose-binding periplasmic protein precursor [[Pasteurella] mairii]
MKLSRRTFIESALTVSACLVAGLTTTPVYSSSSEIIKLGYLVKQPEEPWFQTEWAFADKAAKNLGDVEIIKMAIPDGEKTLNAIDNLAASGAKGFVICAPDPRLGPAIIAKARAYDLKVIAVDELDTARRRTEGSISALIKAGFPEKQIYKSPTKSNDIPGALDAANSMLVQHPEVKNWLIVGMNDNTVLGGVRATEGQGFKPANVVGIGINGVDAVNELSKPNPTGFLGSLLPSPDIHGYRSTEMLYKWIKYGVKPEKFIAVQDVVFLKRDNFKEELAKKGL